MSIAGSERHFLSTKLQFSSSQDRVGLPACVIATARVQDGRDVGSLLAHFDGFERPTELRTPPAPAWITCCPTVCAPDVDRRHLSEIVLCQRISDEGGVAVCADDLR